MNRDLPQLALRRSSILEVRSSNLRSWRSGGSRREPRRQQAPGTWVPGPLPEPRVQPHQFSEPRPASSTRSPPEGQKPKSLDPQGSRFAGSHLGPNLKIGPQGSRLKAADAPVFRAASSLLERGGGPRARKPSSSAEGRGGGGGVRREGGNESMEHGREGLKD